MDMNVILAGFADAFSLYNLAFVLLGVVIGQFVGAIPGIGPVMAMAIAIPFTYSLSPLAAIGFLVGVNKGGLVGGAVPAVLINTPGTPDAAATALDGFPLARQGKPIKATKMALFSSVTGDTVSDLVLITVAAPLAILALKMGPVEMLALMIFTFAMLAGLLNGAFIKGVISVLLGLLVGTVGTAPESYTERFIFGYYELYEGFPLPSVAIGMLAVAEIIRRLVISRGPTEGAMKQLPDNAGEHSRVTFAEYWSCRFTLLRGAGIGTLLGALPGIGSTAAAFMSYAMAKQASKRPETFGKGNLHGIAAAESANSAVMGANLIPLLTLGLPGSVGAALIISAFMIHGIQPGPLLFEEQGQLIYALFGCMIMANFFNLWVGQLGLRLWVKVVSAPESFIFSAALLLCVVGIYMASGGMFGVYVMLAFALLGYLMMNLGYSVVLFIIAFFLEPRLEISLSQSLVLLNGNWAALLNYPVAVLLTIFTLFGLGWFTFTARLGKHSDEG